MLPHYQVGKEVGSYIQNELEALEREQKQIDRQAALLEKQLRSVMESGTGVQFNVVQIEYTSNR